MEFPIFTEPVRHVQCPRCKQLPGNDCQTPRGRKAFTTHQERIKVFFMTPAGNQFGGDVVNEVKHLFRPRPTIWDRLG
jgi:hypothetical protein